MKPRRVRVNNKMQKGYSYVCTEPVGKNFDARFRPDLSPKEMLELGVFGGVYLRDCTGEYPKIWFTKGKFQKKGIYAQDAKINYFKVKASQPLSVWREKGWIHKDDPRGWFEWYCRYYMGRRGEDDERQIKRWVAMRRHISQIKKNCTMGDI
ncbi:MAG: hypothetical protein ACK4FA_00250 [Candidatus Paceibacteria bacterium]